MTKYKIAQYMDADGKFHYRIKQRFRLLWTIPIWTTVRCADLGIRSYIWESTDPEQAVIFKSRLEATDRGNVRIRVKEKT